MFKWSIFMITFLSSVQLSFAGIKVYNEAKNIEGKIILSFYDNSKKGMQMSLLLINRGIISEIPLSQIKGEIRYPKYNLNGEDICFYAENGQSVEEITKSRGIYLIDEKGNSINRIIQGVKLDYSFFDEKHIYYYDYSYERKQPEYFSIDIKTKDIRQLSDKEIEENITSSRWPVRPSQIIKFSPNGKMKLLFKNVDSIYSDLWVADIETGKETLLLDGHGNTTYSNPVWSSDSKKIMLLSRYAFLEYFLLKEEIIVYDIETKKITKILKAPDNSIYGFDWWTPPVNK